MFKFYEVGGKIRDEILGLKSKDVADNEYDEKTNVKQLNVF